MGEISVLSENGDDKILWDVNNKEEIEKAEKEFKEYKEKGYLFFECDSKGNQLRRIEKFDPLSEWLVAVPPTRKG